MSILNRISRLFKADLHGILDQLEEPEMILKQAIRDMQEEIDRAETVLASMSRQKERLQQKQQQLALHIEELHQQLQFCLNEDNEALAKSVIRKKLQAELSLQELSRQLNKISEEITQIRSVNDERREKLQAIRDKLELFGEQHEDEDSITGESTISVSQDDVELAYLYAKQRHAKSVTGDES